MRHIRTSQKENERFHLVREDEKPLDHQITIEIDLNTKLQEIIGFGGVFTEASAYNLLRISKDERTKAIKAYFDPTDGLGYTLGRVSIHGCDFSLGSYLYIDDYGVEKYAIYVDGNLYDQPNLNQYTFNRLEAGRTYQIQIQAIDFVGRTSEKSTVLSLTVT